MTTDHSSPLPADSSVSDLPSTGTDPQSPLTVSERATAPVKEESNATVGSPPEGSSPEATAGEPLSPTSTEATSETAPPPSDPPPSDPPTADPPTADPPSTAPPSSAPSPVGESEGVESNAASTATAPDDIAASVGEAAPPERQDSAAGENAPRAQESTESPPEKTRRRVQLKPTYAPDIAKPVPSIVTPTPPGPTPMEASSTAVPDQSQQSPGSGEQPSTGESPGETSSDAAGQADATAGEKPSADKPAEDVEGSSAPPPPASAEPVALPPKNEQLDADIEAELNAALSGDTGDVPDTEVANLDKIAEAITVPADEDVTRGARLSGTVQSIHGDDMFVDFGVRMPGVLSRRQFGLRKQPMQGEAITVIVSRIDEKEGLIHVNLPSGASRVRGNWDELSVDQTVECQVNQTNKGGLEVSVGSLRGFMPASQVELGYVADLNVYVGQKLRAQITEVNPKRRKLVLSRRRLLEAEREVTEKDFFQKVASGQTYQGRVKTIKDYGAFVDIGGVDGLLHVGQISWSRINHPSDVLTQGQQIEVKVLSVDTEKKKIGLGMRQLTANPWQTAEEKYPSGMVINGKVTRIETFGGFIELEPGIEGLVHISQLDHQRIKTVHEVLRVGQELDVQVLEVDPSRKRISLSVKALKEKPEAAPEPDDAPPVQRVDPESLKGGIGDPTGGQLFGDPGKFGG